MADTKVRPTASQPLEPEYVFEVAAGEVVFREGELGTEMFIIQEGQVEILTGAEGEMERVATLERGDFFGEMSLLDDRPRSATARAVGDGRLLRINGTVFTQLLQDSPEVAVRMMRKLARRLRETDRLLQEARGEKPEAPSTPEAESGPAPERLIHPDSGTEFSLATSAQTTIGRIDPATGIEPDIDLTPVDSQRSISRRHAKIHRRGGKYFLVEEIGTVNGTFLGGERLETGVPTEIDDGDELRLGLVPLRFVAG